MNQHDYSKGMSPEEFLGHGRKRGGNFLKGTWKDDGRVQVLLHTNNPMSPLQRHQYRRIAEKKDDSGRVVEHVVYTENFRCLEPEKVIDEIHFRDRTTGARENPPTICPMCLMDEFVWQLIKRGMNGHKLDWRTPLFQFAAPGKPVELIYAGGMVGLFQSQKISDEEKKLVRELGILQKQPYPNYALRPGEDYAFKQNLRPRLEYVFVVADMSDIESGMRVAIEGAGVGAAMKEEMAKVMKKAEIEKGSRDFGNPVLHPYPFLWEYNKKAEKPSDKYKATGLTGTQLSPFALQLIRGERPDTGGLYRVPNLKKMRMALEAHSNPNVKLPWDYFFAAAIARFGEEGNAGQQEPAADTSFNHGYNAAPPMTGAQAPGPQVGQAYGAHSAPATIPCTHTLQSGVVCGYPMPADALRCAGCGGVYEDDGEPGDAPGGTGWNVSGQGSVNDDRGFNPGGV